MAYQAGQKLGNYQLEGFLGYGGFAEVYLGKHVYLNTQAAIKVLQRQSNAETLEKFLQEARIIAALKHPHIVAVLEFGIEEQRPFLVMSYASHGTLRRRYNRSNVLSPTLVLPHIKQIADALQYAHARKIIHRDVKPDNMLLDENDIILLSDFGLALRERGTYQSARSTDSAGTTMYMAPEQLRGKPCAASDQYALGVVMYEWLCGCLPFDGPDISIVVQHLHEPPMPLRKHVPTLPIEVEAVVLRALEKDPKQRFGSVQELALAFEEACKDIPAAEIPLVENVGTVPLIEDYEYLNAEVTKLPREALSYETIELLTPPSQEKMQALDEVSWPEQYVSLLSPSLSNSLNVDTSAQNAKNVNVVAPDILTTIDAPTTSLNKGRISRRMMIVGIAGMGVVLGGASIWRFSSHGVGTLALDMQAVQKSIETTTSVTTSNHQGSGNSGTGGNSGTNGASASSPAVGNGTTKNGTAKNSTVNPVNGSGSGTTGTTLSSSATPAPSNNGSGSNPIANSTPATVGATPTAIATSGTQPVVPLTVQINNPPSSVQNGTTTVIAVMTNTANISFQFEADYSSLRNSFRQQPPDIMTGTTDGSGNATVSWTPSLSAGQVFFGAAANLFVTATDQNGNSVSSPNVQVQITRF